VNTNASKMLPNITCSGSPDLLDAAIDRRAPVEFRTGDFYCFCKAHFFNGVDLDSLAFPDDKAYCATEWLQEYSNMKTILILIGILIPLGSLLADLLMKNWLMALTNPLSEQ
jgi:hypothetical protein